MLPDYSAPLCVATFEISTDISESQLRGELLPEVFALSPKKIMTYERWHGFRERFLVALGGEQYKLWIESEIDSERLDNTDDFYEYQRLKFITSINKIRSVSDFAHTIVRNTMYLQSEGSLLNEDPYGEPPMPRVIRRFLYENLSDDAFGVSQEEYAYWCRISAFLAEPVSQGFKVSFESIREYEIPFGNSPQTGSKTLAGILANAKHAALLPLVTGGTQVGAAIVAHQWVVAIETAATTGGTVLVLAAAASLTEMMLEFHKTKQPKKHKKAVKKEEREGAPAGEEPGETEASEE